MTDARLILHQIYLKQSSSIMNYDLLLHTALNILWKVLKDEAQTRINESTQIWPKIIDLLKQNEAFWFISSFQVVTYLILQEIS